MKRTTITAQYVGPLDGLCHFLLDEPMPEVSEDASEWGIVKFELYPHEGRMIIGDWRLGPGSGALVAIPGRVDALLSVVHPYDSHPRLIYAGVPAEGTTGVQITGIGLGEPVPAEFTVDQYLGTTTDPFHGTKAWFGRLIPDDETENP